MSRKSVLIILIVLGISSIITCIRIPKVKCVIWIEGHITTDTTWSPVDIYRVINDTYVDPGVTLTILPGALIQFADGFSLVVQGSLNASGIESNPVVLTSSRVAKDPPDPYPGAWNTIKFEGNSSERFWLKHAMLQYAVHGVSIHSSGSAIIEESEITSSSVSGILLTGENNVTIRRNALKQNVYGISCDSSYSHSGSKIIDNEILLNSYNGIHLASNGGDIFNVTVLSNAITSNAGNGIYLSRRNHGRIFGINISLNRVVENLQNGIYIHAYEFDSFIHDTTISSNNVSLNKGNGIYLNSYGLSTYGTQPSSIYRVIISLNSVLLNDGNGIYLTSHGASSFINDITFSSNNVSTNKGNGISLHSIGSVFGPGSIYNITVSSNKVASNEVDGISFTAIDDSEQLVYDLSIEKNLVTSNVRSGVYINGPIDANISGNSIPYNLYGVHFSGTVNNLANYNDIYTNSYGMYVTGASVNAEHNYWGHSTGPYHESLNFEGKGNSVNGDGTDLDFIPFLTSPIGTINERPEAALDVDKTNPNVDETVTFDATGSTDDGRIDYYFFDFGDGINSSWTSLPVVTHKYSQEGKYNATLIVMDDFGVTSLDGDLVYVELTVVPEFPSVLILPLFMTATLLAVIIYRRKTRD